MAIIPEWTSVGVMPPVNPENPTSIERSPYCVSLLDFVERFNISEERRRILKGFLELRKALRLEGACDGFHWINGSFLENIEVIEDRPPNDIDVVTFLHVPAGITEDSPLVVLNIPEATKQKFFVDHRIVPLNTNRPEELVAWTAYWYSLWSHRRSHYWKGFLQISLNTADDNKAAELLRFDDAGGGV